MSILLTLFLMQDCQWGPDLSLHYRSPSSHVFIAVSYAKVSVRTWFAPTLQKPFFTWLLLPFLMQECQWGPDLSLHYISPSLHGFYCRFLCKTVSEDLICPYTKEALLHMDFIAISYAKLYLRTRFVPSLKKSYFTWRFPFCSTRISKVGKCIAFQLWTPTYFSKDIWKNISEGTTTSATPAFVNEIQVQCL